jgi:diguanylate cyclase (GGDEF)-like protein/PAS domain S-box-containing protein
MLACGARIVLTEISCFTGILRLADEVVVPQGQLAIVMKQDDPKSAAVASDPVGDVAIYRLILDNAVDLIVRLDAARNRTYVSPSSREVLGYEPEELLHNSAFGLVHPDDLPIVREVIGQISESLPCLTLAFKMRRKDGRYIWIEARYRHLPMDDGILAMLRDITAQKRAEAALAEANARLEAANIALRRHAHQDGLTGLANRRCFDEALEAEFQRARRQQTPLGLVLLDVDHFKAYNDSYGHIAGDTCLRRVAQAITGTDRRPGDLVARYGGEEIVALLPATDLDGAAAMADRMREAVLALAIEHARGARGLVTVSAGASSLCRFENGEQPVDLINAADHALYQAKADGRNRVRVRPVPVAGGDGADWDGANLISGQSNVSPAQGVRVSLRLDDAVTETLMVTVKGKRIVA